MRITQSMMGRASTEQLMAQRNRLARVQEQASTGLRINRPSDDPVDHRTTMILKDSFSQTGRFLRSINQARPRLIATEDAISDSANLLSDAKVLALQAGNEINGAVARDAIRIQVEGLFERLLSLSNASSPGGAHVFAGLASDVEPFVQTGSFVSGGAPPTVAFAGEASAIDVEIDEGVRIEVTRNGQEVFQGSIDVFSALGELWEGIDQNDSALINNAIGNLELGRDQLLLEQARLGAAGRQANAVADRLVVQEENLTAQISGLEDADVFQVYSELTAQESALQASLAVSARLQGPTLLDFI